MKTFLRIALIVFVIFSWYHVLGIDEVYSVDHHAQGNAASHCFSDASHHAAVLLPVNTSFPTSISSRNVAPLNFSLVTKDLPRGIFRPPISL